MDFSNLAPVKMYCPNCGHKVTGYKDASGGTKITCDRCGMVIYTKLREKKKESLIRVYQPNYN